MSFCPLIGFRIIKRCQTDLKPERLGLIHLCIYCTCSTNTHVWSVCRQLCVMDGWDSLFRNSRSPQGECNSLKDGSVHPLRLLVPPSTALWVTRGRPRDLLMTSRFFSSASSARAASIRLNASDVLLLFALQIWEQWCKWIKWVHQGRYPTTSPFTIKQSNWPWHTGENQ